MHIAIDAHQIGGRSAGAETYVYNLVKHLALLEPNGDRYAVYLNSGQTVDGVQSNPCFEGRGIPSFVTPLRYGFFYPLQSWSKRFEVLHTQFTVPPLLRGRAVVTVHDLSFERFPEFFRPGVRTHMKLMVPWSCRRADHVIAVSKSSKRDLVEFYRLNPQRVTVIYEAPSPIFKPMNIEQASRLVRQTYGIEPPFMLYVGNLEPRKNLGRLLQAFAKLKRNDSLPHKLVIVGQKGWLYDGIFETVRKNSLSQEVFLTGYVPSADLIALYNAASLMIYPSLFEGFGLPVVEAMACGTPVITSFGSSLEEIAAGAAVLVDPYSVCSIATAIEKVAGSAGIQQRLRQAGLARAAQFSFRRMAEQTRDVYHQL